MWIENNFEPHLQRSNWLILNPELGYKFWESVRHSSLPKQRQTFTHVIGSYLKNTLLRGT